MSEIVSKNIDTLGVKYGDAKIEEIWRNKYETPQDFQDPHIHCYSQWSFIIYEDVDVSRTVFLNPYRFRVESQMFSCMMSISTWIIDQNYIMVI